MYFPWLLGAPALLSVVSGGPLPSDHEYELHEVRFHWGKENQRGSEHTVNFKAFPMEVHNRLATQRYTTNAPSLWRLWIFPWRYTTTQHTRNKPTTNAFSILVHSHTATQHYTTNTPSMSRLFPLRYITTQQHNNTLVTQIQSQGFLSSQLHNNNTRKLSQLTVNFKALEMGILNHIQQKTLTHRNIHCKHTLWRTHNSQHTSANYQHTSTNTLTHTTHIIWLQQYLTCSFVPKTCTFPATVWQRAISQWQLMIPGSVPDTCLNNVPLKHTNLFCCSSI